MELLDRFTVFNGFIEVESLMEAVEDGFSSALVLPLRKKDIPDNGGYMCWCLLLAPAGTIEYDDRSGETLDYPVAVTAQDGKSVCGYERIGYVEIETKDTDAWWAWLAQHPNEGRYCHTIKEEACSSESCSFSRVRGRIYLRD